MKIVLDSGGNVVKLLRGDGINRGQHRSKPIEVEWEKGQAPYELGVIDKENLAVQVCITRPDGEQSGWQTMFRKDGTDEKRTYVYPLQGWDTAVSGEAIVSVQWYDYTLTDNLEELTINLVDEIRFIIANGVIAQPVQISSENYNTFVHETLKTLATKLELSKVEEKIFALNVEGGAGAGSVQQRTYEQNSKLNPKANGLGASAFGTGTIANNENEASFGKFNKSNENTLWSVGNGTDEENRKNAFEVLTDGRAKAYGAPKDAEDVIRKNEFDMILPAIKGMALVGVIPGNVERAPIIGESCVNNGRKSLIIGHDCINKPVSLNDDVITTSNSGYDSLIVGRDLTNCSRCNIIAGYNTHNVGTQGSNVYYAASAIGTGLSQGAIKIDGKITQCFTEGQFFTGSYNENKKGLRFAVGNGSRFNKSELSEDQLIGKYYYDENKISVLINENNYKELKNNNAITEIHDRQNAFEVYTDGRAKVYGEPTENDDVVRLKELDNKLDKLPHLTINGVYRVKSSGKIDLQGIGGSVNTSDPGIIPQYFSTGVGSTIPSGRLITGTPTQPAHAANKEYVDKLFGVVTPEMLARLEVVANWFEEDSSGTSTLFKNVEDNTTAIKTLEDTVADIATDEEIIALFA